jgi:hypothetical protein
VLCCSADLETSTWNDPQNSTNHKHLLPLVTHSILLSSKSQDLKNAVVWDVTPCECCKIRRF